MSVPPSVSTPPDAAPVGPPRGVRLGIDVGDVRIGVARCDPGGLIATPVETVSRGAGDLARIAALVAAEQAIEVVVGLPISLSGRDGPAAVKARRFAVALAAELATGAVVGPHSTTSKDAPPAVPVRLVDERLTTVSAERVLRERGKKGAKRRAVVDQAAAVVILQHAIDTERSTGRPAGQEVGQ